MYSATQWFVHQSYAEVETTSEWKPMLEMHVLEPTDARRTWLHAWWPLAPSWIKYPFYGLGSPSGIDLRSKDPQFCNAEEVQLSGLALASAFGLPNTVKDFCKPSGVLSDTSSSDTALFLALTLHGREDVVRILLSIGARIDTVSLRSALEMLVLRNQIAVLRLMLEHGADANTRMENRDTLLMTAVAQGNENMIRLLLDFHADPNLCSERHDMPILSTEDNEEHGIACSALQIACRKEPICIPILYVLLAAGADPNVHGPRLASTPLHEACEAGEVEAARLLITYGADVNTRTYSYGHWVITGPSALFGAVRGLHADIVELLLTHEATLHNNERYLCRIVEDCGSGSTQKVTHITQMLIATGADINSDIDEGTPLYLAAKWGNTPMVRLLLMNGADVTVRSRSDKLSPLEIARKRGHTEVENILPSLG
jgi:hypothetical protein